MRNSVKFSIAALSLAIGTSACRDANANSGVAQAELKRDLEMAASATISLAAPKVDSALLKFEGQPKSAPQASPPLGRVLARERFSPRPRPFAPSLSSRCDVVESEMTETVADASGPESTEPVAVAPRPTPVGDYGTGGGIFGGGSGGGVVIRGGGVDGDNCELHRRGGRRGGPVYIPQTPGPIAGVSFPRRPGTSIGGGFGGGRRSPVMGGGSRVSGVSSGMQGVSRPSMGRRGR